MYELSMLTFKIYSRAKKGTDMDMKKAHYSPVSWVQECVKKNNLIVLIIDGKQDKIVASWVAERLAKAIEGAEFI